MLIVISPSKGQDFESEWESGMATVPECLKHSKKLVVELKKLSLEDIQKLMSVSERIADLNFSRFKKFKTPFTTANAKPAFFAFTGDVYSGFSKHEYTHDDLEYAQSHLRILSGLYGVLRPMDLIQPYRLEMKTKLKTTRGDNLYRFWGDIITEKLNREFATCKDKVFVNLASDEYFRAINVKKLSAEVIKVNFKEIKNGKARVIAVFAKRARGLMSDYILRKRIETISGIKKFNVANYKYSAFDSDKKNIIFTRKQP